MLSDDDGEAEKFETLGSMCCQTFQALVFDFEGTVRSRVTGKSGSIIRLERSREKEQPLRVIEIEPTIGDMNNLVDAILKVSDGLPESPPSISVDTYLTFHPGIPLDLLTGTSGGQLHPLIRLKAGIIALDP